MPSSLRSPGRRERPEVARGVLAQFQEVFELGARHLVAAVLAGEAGSVDHPPHLQTRRMTGAGCVIRRPVHLLVHPERENGPWRAKGFRRPGAVFRMERMTGIEPPTVRVLTCPNARIRRQWRCPSLCCSWFPHVALAPVHPAGARGRCRGAPSRVHRGLDRTPPGRRAEREGGERGPVESSAWDAENAICG